VSALLAVADWVLL